MSRHLYSLLSIAGFDSGNGAGVETDIKVFDLLGFHGVGAITAITAQNTTGVKKIYPLTGEQLREQIRTVFEDFEVIGVKTGMVYNSEQVKVIKDELRDKNLPIVIDPVIFAKDGTSLIDEPKSFMELIKGAFAITPNSDEATILVKGRREEVKNQRELCVDLLNKYDNNYVVLKGGHIQGDRSKDVLCWKEGITEFYLPRRLSKDTHGTGSVFASALLAYYLKIGNMIEAVSKAKLLVYRGISHGINAGRGIGPIDPSVQLRKEAMKFKVMEDMRRFSHFINQYNNNFYHLIPEVQSNLAHSIEPELVDDLNDIATFEGRIIKEWNGNVRVGFPSVFGYPTHTARLLLGLIKRGVKCDSLINVRFDERYVKALIDNGYRVIEIDREKEPSWGEGKTMEWIAELSYRENATVAFDRGMKGKEAMIRIWSYGIYDIIKALKVLLD